nr:MAG TPA: hypothetical protein [Caudoviricetes sp.]
MRQQNHSNNPLIQRHRAKSAFLSWHCRIFAINLLPVCYSKRFK